ncbi:MAG TPA: N-acetylmuramoyl-L-alanine amidase-like domain-containing protein [Anaeromyxobacteraceae bacterium]|nr:N-acetylmuramoyl-L-alanine amidase-like domain-containing protein [Anaeromyxobacteraceae bacterium]
MHRPLALLVALAAQPSPDAVRGAAAPAAPPGLVRALEGFPAGARRAVAATAPLVGRPYVLNPLGEGGGFDPDPRFRLDAFDCWTFVETAVALGSAASLDEARLALDDVRYSGAVDYGHRNHEVLSQWVPANGGKGWIADAAAEIAGPRAQDAAVEYSAARWDAVARAGHAIPGLARDRLPEGRFAVGMVAPADLGAVERRIPEGAIALVVREDLPDRSTRVSHAGLVVVRPDGSRWVRHASSAAGVMRVVEEPLARFLRAQQRAMRWRVSGLAFLSVLDNRARVAALAAAAQAAGRPPGPQPSGPAALPPPPRM